MATSNNSRDVKMTLSVETLGAENIETLRTSVSDLAKQGGDAAPEFQKLADEIGRLGQQATALQAFQQLSDETGTLAQRQAQASAASDELKSKLDTLSDKTQEAVAVQRASAAALADAQAAARATRDELALLSATTDRASKTEAEYTTKVEALKVAKIEQRAEVERLSAALAASSAQVKIAEESEAQLSGAYRASAAAAKATGLALSANVAEVGRAAAAAHELGVVTDDVAAAQVELVRGLNSADNAAEVLKLRIAALADQERELAAIGAFEKQAEDARRMVVAGEYATLFDEALQRLATTEKELKAQSNEDKWQREAAALVDASEAAQKLAHETALLAAVEKELVAQSAFEKQAEDARKLVQAGEYVRFWKEELAKADTQATATAEAAQVAGQKISDAFRTLGVRSAQELQTEITQVRAAMETVRTSAGTTGQSLSGAFAAGEVRVQVLEREIRAVSGSLTTADRAAKLFSNSLGQISSGNVIADGVGYLVNKVKELGAAFLGALVQGDQMRRGLTAIYKDAGVAAAQIDFLRKSSSESGVAFGQLTGEFVKFSASMKSANIPLEQSNNLFKAVTAASASLGLGTEATAGALNALGQMASKGTVSMEELRQQLGDRLPGAMGLTAKGLGITEGQLVKLVESGQLATRDFIVPFTEALGTMKGEVDGVVPSFDRFKGLLSEVAQGAGDAGWTKVLGLAIKVLGGTVGVFVLGLSSLSEALFLVIKGMAAMAVAFTSPKAALELMTDAVEQSRLRLTGQATALNNLIEPSEAAANATGKHTAAMTTNMAEVIRSVNANMGLSGAQKLAALSTALAGDASLDAAAKIVQYNVASTELLKQQEAQTEAYGKSAKAAKQQGDTQVELAKLTGDNTAIQQAGVVAADLYSAALDKVSKSQADETAILVAQKAELIASAEKRGLDADQIKLQTDALGKLIVKSQSETEQAVQAALAAKAALFERQLAIEKLKDHSGAVDEYRKKMDDAALSLKEYERLALNGKKTDEDMATARRALTAATVLYRDSLTDLIAKTDLETRAKTANLQLQSAQMKAGADHSLSLAAEARARGDSATAIYYEIKAREQSIAVLKLEMQIRDLESQAALATIELKRKMITVMDEEGVRKLAILDIEKKLVEIKLVANGTTKEAIAALERENTTLKMGIDLRGGSTAGIHADTSARGANVDAINAQSEALKHLQEITSRPNPGTKSALTKDDMKGVDNSGLFSLQQKSQSGTLGAGDLTTAQAAFDAAKTNLDVYQKNWTVFGTEGAKSIQDTYNESRMLLEKVQAAVTSATPDPNLVKQTVKTNLLTGDQTLTNTSKAGVEKITVAPDGTVTKASTTTVNINLGGKKTAVNVSSPADANALTSILRQLESGKGTSS